MSSRCGFRSAAGNHCISLLQICREGDAPDANKEAWKLMYTLIRHHNGVVAWMEGNGKLLNQLLEIVSIGASMTVVRNSLYYIAKVCAKRCAGQDQRVGVHSVQCLARGGVVLVCAENNTCVS